MKWGNPFFFGLFREKIGEGSGVHALSGNSPKEKRFGNIGLPRLQDRWGGQRGISSSRDRRRRAESEGLRTWIKEGAIQGSWPREGGQPGRTIRSRQSVLSKDRGQGRGDRSSGWVARTVKSLPGV